MFQCKMDEIFSDGLNDCGIAYDILLIGYDDNGADHDAEVHTRCYGDAKRST